MDFENKQLCEFCYSYLRIGNYVTYCKIIKYDESGLEKNIVRNFGLWFKAEARELSPFWKVFYGEQAPVLEDDEMVLETPSHSNQSVTKHRGDKDKEVIVVSKGEGDSRQVGGSHTELNLLGIDLCAKTLR